MIALAGVVAVAGSAYVWVRVFGLAASLLAQGRATRAGVEPSTRSAGNQ